jgi:hypothetical protein
MTKRYVDHYLEDIVVLVRNISNDFSALQKRLALWSRDGYPTGTGVSAGKGSISDPTASAVLISDDIGKDRDRLSTIIIQAHDLLREADIIRTRYMTTETRTAKHNASLSKCANIHGCPDDTWAAKAGRCLVCYEYQRRNLRDRVSRQKSAAHE